MTRVSTMAREERLSRPRPERLGLPFVLILVYLFMEYARPTNPMKIPMAISIVLFVNWLVLPKKHWSPQVILFALLMAVIAIMGPFAINSYSIWMGFRNMGVQLFCIAVPLIHFVSSMRKLSIYVNILITVYLYVAMYGILYGGRGPGGIIGDENDLSLAVNMALPFAFVSVFSARRVTHKLFYVGSFILMLTCIISTYSRGGFLGLLPVLAYCFFLLPKKRTALALGFILGIGVLMVAPQGYWDEMATIERDAYDTEQGTGALRREYWAIAWRMFEDNPLVGVGLDNFTWNIPEYQTTEQYDRIGRSFGGQAAHSLYFTILAELGIAGALIFAAIVWYMVKDTGYVIRIAREARRRKLGLGGPPGTLSHDLGKAELYAHAVRASLLSFLVSGVFLSVFTYVHFWLLTAFMVALKRFVQERVREDADGG